MNHKMKLQSEMFRMIKSGLKTIEMRLDDDKRMRIKVGDIIEFETLDNNSDILTVVVQDKYYFNSFDELYHILPLLQCGYTSDNVANAKPSDMDRYYSKEEQSKYAVVAFKIAVIR